jgi:NADPH:quinone reductase-like Zn-dependent oxidoreductase
MEAHLGALMNIKALKPVLGKVYSLEEASQAQYDVINNSGTRGRLTIKIPQNN